jgi:hypothetical protein
MHTHISTHTNLELIVHKEQIMKYPYPVMARVDSKTLDWSGMTFASMQMCYLYMCIHVNIHKTYINNHVQSTTKYWEEWRNRKRKVQSTHTHTPNNPPQPYTSLNGLGILKQLQWLRKLQQQTYCARAWQHHLCVPESLKGWSSRCEYFDPEKH